MVTKCEGGILTIQINLKEMDGMTGKGNILVASTHGWKKIEDVSLSLNVVRRV